MALSTTTKGFASRSLSHGLMNARLVPGRIHVRKALVAEVICITSVIMWPGPQLL